MVIDCKRRDLQFAAGQFLVPREMRSIMPRAPDRPAGIVAVDIRAVQIGKTIAIINNSASERTRFGVVMLDGGRNRRSGTELAIEIKRMAPFINTPSVVLTAPDEVRALPKILAVITDPDVAGFPVNAHAPGIAQPISPNLGPRIRPADKRIVFRDRIRAAAFRVIDV